MIKDLVPVTLLLSNMLQFTSVHCLHIDLITSLCVRTLLRLCLCGVSFGAPGYLCSCWHEAVITCVFPVWERWGWLLETHDFFVQQWATVEAEMVVYTHTQTLKFCGNLWVSQH